MAQEKPKLPKHRSEVAKSLEDARFAPRVVRDKTKYSRKGKAHDRQHIKSLREDD